MIAEGLVLDLDPADLSAIEDVERDAHGNVRIAEVNIGEILKQQVNNRLKEFGIKATIVEKNIGYELRCADPIPLDMEYTRDLGYAAAKFILSGGNAAMVSMQGGRVRADPVHAVARSGDRTRHDPAGEHPLRALRHRAQLHDPAEARGLPRSRTRRPSSRPRAASPSSGSGRSSST